MPPRKKPAAQQKTPKIDAPSSGVKIRMYRQGHGDCYLLTFRKNDGSPFHLLIDCGLWTGSEIKPDNTIDKIIANIADVTGGRVDLIVVTHEHMDHVNGFAKNDPAGQPYFGKIDFDRLWLAWTEDETDDLANQLRERFHDTLLALAAADVRLENAGHGIDSGRRTVLRQLLSF